MPGLFKATHVTITLLPAGYRIRRSGVLAPYLLLRGPSGQASLIPKIILPIFNVRRVTLNKKKHSRSFREKLASHARRLNVSIIKLVGAASKAK